MSKRIRLYEWEELISLPIGSKLHEIHGGGKVNNEYELVEVLDERLCQLRKLGEGERPFNLSNNHFNKCNESGVRLYHIKPEHFDDDMFKIS